MDKEEPTTVDLSTKLCNWEKKCPGEYHHLTSENSSHTGPPYCLAYITRAPIPSCGGTKLVYVLDDSVRVPCVVGEHHDAYGRPWHGHYPEVHSDEDCPGWTPSTDLAVWEQAVFTAWPHILIVKEIDHVRLTGPGMFSIGVGHGLSALQSALAQVMEKETENGTI